MKLPQEVILAKEVLKDYQKKIAAKRKSKIPWSRAEALRVLCADIRAAVPDLLPCPFCGGIPNFIVGSAARPWCCSVDCSCEVNTSWTLTRDDIEIPLGKPGKPDFSEALEIASRAWKAWNRRCEEK